MADISEFRRNEMMRLLEQRRGEAIYDISRLRVAIGRCERELIEIEDAMQDLNNDVKGDD